MKIFGLGVPELLIILAVALLIFGPKALPKLGRSMGKAVKGLREGLGSKKEEATADTQLEETTQTAAAKPRKKKKPAAAKTATATETTTAEASQETVAEATAAAATAKAAATKAEEEAPTTAE
jgi:sec-independent protein translocase protein TatA